MSGKDFGPAQAPVRTAYGDVVPQAAAAAAIPGVRRPGGPVSVLAATVGAAVLQRARAGRYEEAPRLLRSNAGDPGAPAPVPAPGVTGHRRFTLAELTALIE